MQTIVDICSRANGFVAINAAPARPLPAAVIERCDLFIVNQEERAALPELARARTVAVTEGPPAPCYCATTWRWHGDHPRPPRWCPPLVLATPSAPQSFSP